MATLVVKGVPVELRRRLEERARRNGRSVGREVIESLEASFGRPLVDVDATLAEAREVRRGLEHRLTDREITRLKRQGRP